MLRRLKGNQFRCETNLGLVLLRRHMATLLRACLLVGLWTAGSRDAGLLLRMGGVAAQSLPSSSSGQVSLRATSTAPASSPAAPSSSSSPPPSSSAPPPASSSSSSTSAESSSSPSPSAAPSTLPSPSSTSTTSTASAAASSTTLTTTTTTTTTTSTTTTTTTTTTSPSPSPTSSAQCIPLVASSVCPGYPGYYINANSPMLTILNAGAPGTVAEFDLLVKRAVQAGPDTPLAGQCLNWDASQIRYAQQFFCDYYLHLPEVRGDATTDCNVIMNVMTAGLPRIANDTCLDFENTALSYIGMCIRSGQPTTQFQSFADEICQNAAVAAVHINMSLDTSSEHLSCGYGSVSRNASSGVWNAFQHCNPSVRGADPNDPCCLYDPAIVKAIKEGGVQLLPDIPDFTCEVYFGKSLQVSCGTIVGSVLFAAMSVLSILIVWGRIWLARGVCGQRRKEEEDVGDWRKNAIVDESIHPSARAWSADSVAGSSSHEGRSKRHSAAPSDSKRHSVLGTGAEGPKRHSAVIAMARFEDAETGISPQGSGKGRGRPSSLTPVALRPMGAGYSPVSAGVGTSMGRPPFATNGRGSSRSEQGSAKSSGVEPAPASAQSSGIDPGLGLIGTIHVPSVLEGYRAAYEFKGQVDQGEMEQLSAGDRVQVLGAVGNGMVAAKNLESGQHGAIPLNILGRY